MGRKRKPPGDYEVGYGKPPVHSRFKPGESGRKRGAPKRAATLHDDFEAALRERMPVPKGGKMVMKSMQQLLVHSAVARAVKGDMRAMSLILRHIERFEGQQPAQATREETLTPEEQEILNDLLAEARRKHGAGEQ